MMLLTTHLTDRSQWKEEQSRKIHHEVKAGTNENICVRMIPREPHAAALEDFVLVRKTRDGEVTDVYRTEHLSYVQFWGLVSFDPRQWEPQEHSRECKEVKNPQLRFGWKLPYVIVNDSQGVWVWHLRAV